MKRREFIQVSSLSLASLLAHGCDVPSSFDVNYLNDMSIGHLVFESQQFPVSGKISTDYVIVGGGVAGLSAAYQLREKNFLLFELSELWGGSSAGTDMGNSSLCHGAHYDLSYPQNYGDDVLKMLEELSIVQFDTFSSSWKFVNKKYLIPKKWESNTLAHGTFRKDVLPDSSEKSLFNSLMKSYSGSMPMPTRLINEEFRALDGIDFKSWLEQQIRVSREFLEGLDYHMKDDYGAPADQVSALAGIHYFACRPYYTKAVELFSPPEGNSYFVKKLLESIPDEKLKNAHVVKSIQELENGQLKVEVIDAVNKEIIHVTCNKVIYAGHKHALKYIFPKGFPFFAQVTYAPWVVVNVITKGLDTVNTFWQNEIISEDRSLLGFVDSASQYNSNPGARVFTVYYCFKPEEREMMSLIQERKNSFVDRTISYLESYFDKPLKSKILKAYIKQMGHAMPIPRPGYLFRDANHQRPNPNILYAGVDNGRLPLLFEAMDSGIQATKLALY